MILNAHSYYSLRYGVLSNEDLIAAAVANNYEAMAITDINNSAGVLEFVKLAFEKNIKPIVGMEFRQHHELLFIAIAMNHEGFKEINDLQTRFNLYQIDIQRRPIFHRCFIIYPYGTKLHDLKEHEYIGIKPSELNKIATEKKSLATKILHPT